MHGLLIPKVVNVSELNRHDLSCGFDPKSTYGAKKKNILKDGRFFSVLGLLNFYPKTGFLIILLISSSYSNKL